MSTAVPHLARVCLAILLCAAALLTVALPIGVGVTGHAYAEVSHLVPVVSVAAVLAGLGLCVGPVAGIALVGHLSARPVAIPAVVRWVRVAATGAAVAAALCVLVCTHLVVVVGVGGPLVVAAIPVGAACVGATVTLTHLVTAALRDPTAG